jgi:hypothetical protein
MVDMMPAYPASPPPTIPPGRYLLIIGAMKSSTSSLFDYLQQHEQICPSKIKEPEYFSDKPVASLAHYEDLWAYEPARHRYVMEASTGYTKNSRDDIPLRIHRHGLRPKLIYLLREPLSRIESHYNFMRYGTAHDWRLKFDDNHLIETSRYFSQAEKFADVFGRENMLIMMMDDFIGKEPTCIRRLFDFLGLPAFTKERDIPHSNALADRRSNRYRLVASRVPRSLRQLAPTSLKRSAQRLDRRFHRRPEERLSEEQRARIRERLGPEMAELQRVYGVDVARWGF